MTVLLLSVLLLSILFYFTALAVYFITITAVIAIITVIRCRTLGDNVLGGGGIWWCRLDVAYCLGIFLYLWSLWLPSLLYITNLPVTGNIFFSFLLTDCFSDYF